MNEKSKEQQEYWNGKAKSFRRYDAKRDRYATDIFDTMNFHGVSLSDKTVLDLGCGSGGFSIEMAKEGAKVTSMDISLEMLKMLAEDCIISGMTDIAIIESDWNSYEGNEKYDIIFCSLTPAIHDDTTREKLRQHANNWVIYLGFMPLTEPDAMDELYKMHHTKHRLMIGAPEMHDWLKRSGIEYSAYSFKKGRTSVQSKKDMMASCCEMLEMSGAKPDLPLVEQFIERFKNKDGRYVHSSVANVDMIIWDNSAYRS